jgi:hypothetical protein
MRAGSFPVPVSPNSKTPALQLAMVANAATCLTKLGLEPIKSCARAVARAVDSPRHPNCSLCLLCFESCPRGATYPTPARFSLHFFALRCNKMTTTVAPEEVGPSE